MVRQGKSASTYLSSQSTSLMSTRMPGRLLTTRGQITASHIHCRA